MGIVIIIAVIIIGVGYMLSSILKNPEGVAAVGNAVSDGMRASYGLPTGGNKATNINIMIIIAYVLTVAFLILAVLTIIFFFKWMALKNPLTGIF
jgi:hypothetical protein